MKHEHQPSFEEAKQAVRTILRWIGEDPDREGLVDTPKRFVNALKEHTSGYEHDEKTLSLTCFEYTENYSEMVLLKDIEFTSHCEHHIQPFTGVAHIAYFPDTRIVGLSKLARIVDIFAKRLQTQEIMTQQIINSLQKNLNPRGCAVQVIATHQCMATRGVKKPGARMITSAYSGVFDQNPDYQNRFLQATQV